MKMDELVNELVIGGGGDRADGRHFRNKTELEEDSYVTNFGNKIRRVAKVFSYTFWRTQIKNDVFWSVQGCDRDDYGAIWIVTQYFGPPEGAGRYQQEVTLRHPAEKKIKMTYTSPLKPGENCINVSKVMVHHFKDKKRQHPQLRVQAGEGETETVSAQDRVKMQVIQCKFKKKKTKGVKKQTKTRTGDAIGSVIFAALIKERWRSIFRRRHRSGRFNDVRNNTNGALIFFSLQPGSFRFLSRNMQIRRN